MPIDASDSRIVDLCCRFEDVVRDTLQDAPRATGPPMEIKFKKGVEVTPHKVLTTRPIPCYMEEEADHMIDDMMNTNVIGKLDGNTPTESLSRGHFVLKPDGKRLRLVTDFVELNKFIERPVDPFPKPDIIFKSIRAGSRWFATMDAPHGYFQQALSKESQLLTAFLLPQGRFYYKVAPMGLNPSGDCQTRLCWASRVSLSWWTTSWSRLTPRNSCLRGSRPCWSAAGSMASS